MIITSVDFLIGCSFVDKGMAAFSKLPILATSSKKLVKLATTTIVAAVAEFFLTEWIFPIFFNFFFEFIDQKQPNYLMKLSKLIDFASI